MSPCTRLPEMRLVKVYPSVSYQSIIGFGSALTEASGVVFSHLNPENRTRFLSQHFGSDGNCYSLARLPIQSCDFSLTSRSYMSAPRNASLDSFSIDDDWGYVIPLALQAKETNTELSFIASPWSPPAWAKTNLNMKYGGHLRKRHYATWAAMIARYVMDYRSLGLNIDRITVQNEPEATQIWESCLFNAQQEAAFVRDHLRAALDHAGASNVKILIWDHNKQGLLDRTSAVLADEIAARSVDGVAFHWYSGDHFEAVRATRDLIGNRELIFSEGCDFYSQADPAWEIPHAEHYAREIIGDLENGANAILDWNILLDAHGGPNHVGNYCDAPVMYDEVLGELHFRRPFYYLGHFSRFIKPGAVRLLTTRYTLDLETTTFKNPDGTCATVVLNRHDRDIDFTLAIGGNQIERRKADLTAAAHSIMTLVWSNGPVK